MNDSRELHYLKLQQHIPTGPPLDAIRDVAAFCGSHLLGSIALLLSPLVALGHLLRGMFSGFLLPLKLAWGSAAQASAGN